MPTPNEAKTRQDLIDPLLEKAGWHVKDRALVGTDIPVDGFDPAAWQRYPVIDYLEGDDF